MEGPTSSWGSRNRITCQTLQEHDDDDDDDEEKKGLTPYIGYNLIPQTPTHRSARAWDTTPPIQWIPALSLG